VELERLAAVVRPRAAWEAIDLGFSMARLWWLDIMRPWLVLTLPLFVGLNWLLLDYLWLVPLLFWWFKPWFERIPLYVASRALFGDTPSMRQTLTACPGLLVHRSIAAVTWSRISLTRSFYLPLWQLEKLSGQAYRDRASILAPKSHSDAMWLTIICIHFETLLIACVTLFVFLMIPDSLYEFDPVDVISGLPVAFQLLINIAYYSAITLLEPFYVCAGFSLYLNRRTSLEAWDIELAFRRLRKRLQAERI